MMLPRVEELLREMNAALAGGPLNYSSSSAANDVYEGFIFGLVLRAARAAGAVVEYRDVAGNLTSNLVFRTSPGMIYSAAHAYTYAVLDFPRCPTLELHLGVKVQGRSGVLHECDVLVLSKDEADLARNRNVAPRGPHSLIAVECKFYSSNLGIELARGFHGLHTDLSVRYPFFVSNARSRNVERFLSYLRRKWQNGVVPRGDKAAYFESQVQEAFKEFVAMRGALTS